jgi:hypothetical protein
MVETYVHVDYDQHIPLEKNEARALQKALCRNLLVHRASLRLTTLGNNDMYRLDGVVVDTDEPEQFEMDKHHVIERAIREIKGV